MRIERMECEQERPGPSYGGWDPAYLMMPQIAAGPVRITLTLCEYYAGEGRRLAAHLVRLEGKAIDIQAGGEPWYPSLEEQITELSNAMIEKKRENRELRERVQQQRDEIVEHERRQTEARHVLEEDS